MTEITAPVRVRFAPSPTGFLHIGGVRTALFNWLFARHYGGQFILRIEDTDRKRFVEGAEESLMQSLRWVGIDWDEGPVIGGPHGPYHQSLRTAIYQQHAQQLLDVGLAYKSFVGEAELEALRANAKARGLASFRYRGAERDWTPAQVAEAETQGLPYTIRLKTPLDGETSFSDLVRGGDQITVQNNQLQDIVLIKSDGFPVYHLAHLVDDHLMDITHVLRADEWVPSTPYHIIMYKALGWQPPLFAHLPPVLRQDGKGKLSKRKDDVAANRFWERGYLAEAMFNYLALQGWSYDDHTEIMTRAEIVDRFTIERVQASPARWNPDKLKDMNGIYIRKLEASQVAERITPYLADAGLIESPPTDEQRGYVTRLVPLVHERLEELGEAPELLEFFFRDVGDPNVNLLIPKKMDAASTSAALSAAQRSLATIETWSEGQLEETLRALVEELGVKPGQLFGAIRVAITGRTVAPPLFETLAALGKDHSLARIAAAAAALG